MPPNRRWRRGERPCQPTTGGGSSVGARTIPPARHHNLTVEGPQTFSTERAQHELKAGRAAGEQRIKEQTNAHVLAQEAKDNDLRRLTFKIVLLMLIGVLIFSFVVATKSTNGTTRSWAQGIVTTIKGGLVGGVVGYFTARAASSSPSSSCRPERTAHNRSTRPGFEALIPRRVVRLHQRGARPTAQTERWSAIADVGSSA